MYLEYYKKKEEQNCFLKKNNQPKKRVEAKNEKHWRKLRRIYFHRFFEDCFHHRKTFNWVKTSVASRYNTAKPLIGRAHTHTHTHTRAQRSSQLFSRCRFDRLIALLHPPLTKEKERERETLVFVTRTVFTYGFISLVSPDHAIQFRRVSWRGPWSKGPPTTKSKFPLEQWKYASIKENARTDGIITLLLARLASHDISHFKYFCVDGNLSFEQVEFNPRFERN